MWSQVLNVVLKNLFKYSPLIVLSLVLAFTANLARVYYNDAQSSKQKYEKLIGVEEKYEQLSKNLAELQVNYVREKDLNREYGKKFTAKEREIAALKGEIKTLASATFTIQNFPHEQDAPDQVTDEFVKQEVLHRDTDGPGPPVGYVQLWKTGKTVSSLYASEIAVDSAVTRTPDGRYHVLTKANFILQDETTLRPQWIGKPYPLAITGGEVWINPVQDGGNIQLERKFRTTPSVNMGLFLGASQERPEYGIHTDLSLWGYGRTDNDLDYKLGAVGINASRSYLDINLNPVSYRVGNHIPLFKDLYMGPGIGYGTSGPVFFLSLTSTL